MSKTQEKYGENRRNVIYSKMWWEQIDSSLVSDGWSVALVLWWHHSEGMFAQIDDGQDLAFMLYFIYLRWVGGWRGGIPPGMAHKRFLNDDRSHVIELSDWRVWESDHCPSNVTWAGLKVQVRPHLMMVRKSVSHPTQQIPPCWEVWGFSKTGICSLFNSRGKNFHIRRIKQEHSTHGLMI